MLSQFDCTRRADGLSPGSMRSLLAKVTVGSKRMIGERRGLAMDLDELVRRADPSRETASPDGSSAIAQWTYGQITRAEVRMPHPYPRPRVVLAGIMALGLALALVVGELIGGTNRPPTASGAAALRHAAVTVSDQSGPTLASGQFLYTETTTLYQVTVFQSGVDRTGSTTSAYAQYLETQQSWADAKGSGQALLRRGPLQFTSEADRAAWSASAAGRRFSSQFSQSVVEPSLRQSVPQVSGLSTNPSRLDRQIAHGLDGSNIDHIAAGPTAVFQRAARLLVGPVSGMTSALAAALYRVLSDQSGVTLLGPTTDHLGRSGIGISMSSPKGVSELIIDPTSGSALEIQYPPPPSSLASPSGAPIVRCSQAAECGTPVGHLSPLGSGYSVAPIWTDTVTTEIVNAAGSTTSLGAPGL
jgi:hypothetical protein